MGKVACSMAVLLPVTAGFAAEIEEHRNVTYQVYGRQALKVDLAKPPGDGPFPAIVFVHGGGWFAGNRRQYSDEIRTAARRGYVGVSVGYRLTGIKSTGRDRHYTPFPAQIHDVKCAVRWLRANAEAYGVDPRRIGSSGKSSGGHLSLLLGTSDVRAGLEGPGYEQYSSRVQAVVCYAGPADLVFMGQRPVMTTGTVASFLGGSFSSRPRVWWLASPMTHVSRDDPPILTIHGARDKRVPVNQALRFDLAVRRVGGRHRLMLFEDGGHSLGGENARKAREAMYDFFDANLKHASN